MKMRAFKSQKLWRDNALEMIEKQGSNLHWRRLDDKEYDQQLRAKMIEETDEVSHTTSRADLIEELSDVFEVIDALCLLHGFTRDEIMAIQTKKRAIRGGFTKRIFAERVEHPVGSAMEKYCLAAPEKYPEIIEET